MPSKAYWATLRLGGTTGASDKINGADLADKDMLALLESTDTARFYWLDDDASAAEGEGATNPDTNPGTKSWLLLGITLPNTGLHLLDTDASHDLIIKPGSDLTADRILTITTGDVAKTLNVGGLNIVAKTSAYTAIATDDVITCGAGNETFTIDLPIPVSTKVYFIKNVGTGVITADADTTGSTTIDGQTTQTINQYECLMVVADASVYWAI